MSLREMGLRSALWSRQKRRAMLVLNDISLRIAGKLLLDGASARIPDGARVGLVGRNGTGKTTLFRAITGDTPIEHGAIEISARNHIGRLAQEAPDGPGILARNRAQGRRGTRAAARRGGNRERPASHRRYPDQACRYRRTFGARSRGRNPRWPRLLARGPAATVLGVLWRLAHAGGARGDAVRGARPAPARRADQLSRPRRYALARRPHRTLSAHGDRHQP